MRLPALTALRARYLSLAAVPVGLIVSSLVVWQASNATFSATATNSANAWSAGRVALSSAPGTAVFAASGLRPGSNGTRCVKVTYDGDLAATVRLYLKNSDLTGTGLAQYLTFQVNEGAGSAVDCGDFVQSANVYNATGLTDPTRTLAAFSTAARDFTTGVGTWSVTPNATKTYQFRWQLQDDNSAQGLTSSATFTWEAQSS
jgi:hypothetical protein